MAGDIGLLVDPAAVFTGDAVFDAVGVDMPEGDTLDARLKQNACLRGTPWMPD